MVINVKSILNYYYGIINSDANDNNGYFSYNNHLFCLYEYKRNINEIDSLVLLNKYMLDSGIHINKIVFNNLNQALTFYNGIYYCLVLINYEYSRGHFNFFLAPNDKRLSILKRNDWANLWSAKVDYIEYQIRHLENSFPLLINSVNYYIGMAENAISYFKLLNLNTQNLYVNHRRINKNDLYNPLELVIDYKVRDLSEYLKECFFNKEKTVYEIKKFIGGIELNNIDYILLYVRMIYPSYYFDVYERIVNNNLDEKEINKITELADDYEELLYEIYSLIKHKTNILGIDWINSKFLK